MYVFWRQRDKSRTVILSILLFIFYSICEIKTICNLSDNLGVPTDVFWPATVLIGAETDVAHYHAASLAVALRQGYW